MHVFWLAGVVHEWLLVPSSASMCAISDIGDERRARCRRTRSFRRLVKIKSGYRRDRRCWASDQRETLKTKQGCSKYQERRRDHLEALDGKDPREKSKKRSKNCGRTPEYCVSRVNRGSTASFASCSSSCFAALAALQSSLQLAIAGRMNVSNMAAELAAVRRLIIPLTGHTGWPSDLVVELN
jgi:hypothetical protein